MKRESPLRVLLTGLTLAGLTVIVSSPATAQSFDCRKATTAVEKLVCANAELSKLDEHMADVFTQAKSNVDVNVIGQATWLRNVRNRCATVACVKDVYEDRITYLYTLVPVVKADGYWWRENETFSPGIYEAIVEAKVYSDLDESADVKGMLIKKGTRINVYSAGYHGEKPPSIDWFDLSEGHECNGKNLPWEDFGWIGTLAKDFRRVGDLRSPIYENGVITNCATTNAVSAIIGTGSATPK